MEADTLYESDEYEEFLQALEVSKYPDTPADVLGKLGTHRSASIRRAVATNPNTPVEVIKTLLFDDDVWVNSSALRNSSLPLHDFVDSDDLRIRTGVAVHPSATLDILVKLVKDEFAAVSLAAQYQLDSFDDDVFRSSLIRYGFVELLALPRAGAMKVLCSGGAAKNEYS